MSRLPAYSKNVSSIQKNLILWAIVLLLFGELMVDGLDLLQGDGYIIFSRWGYSCLFVFSIGLTKVLSASGLLIPRLRQMAVFGIVSLALLGVYIHFKHQDVVGLLIDVMNIGLAAMVYWYSSSRFHVPH